MAGYPGKQGRKPLPAAMKRLRGNPGKRPIPDAADVPVPANMPPAPEYLSTMAQREWQRIGSILLASGLYSDADFVALAAYCQAFGRWIEAEEKLKDHGTVILSPNRFPVQSPYLAIANKAMEQMVKIAAEFGLTPSSRSRVQPMRKNDDTDEDAEFFGDLRIVK